MPDKKGRFTDKEATFVEAFVGTGDATYAATKAGYSQPQVRGAQLAAKPAVIAEVLRCQLEKLVLTGVPVAVSTLIEIASDKTKPANARVGAADKIMGHAKDLAGSAAREAFEMTAEELAAAIRARLDAETIDVTPTPVEPSDEADPFG